jgi:hypothetical protein
MDPYADIDLDSESVWLDGTWYARDQLARRIKEMIEAGDFRVARPSQALERLEAALGQAQVLSVRMSADLADAANATAERLGRPVGHLVREAVAYYLAAAAAYGASQGRIAEEPAPPASPSQPAEPAEGSFFRRTT